MKRIIKNAAGIMAAIMSIGCGLMAMEPIVNAAGVAIDSVNFPDKDFRNYVAVTLDLDSDGMLSDSEIASVAVIEGQNFFNINETHSVAGIEFFPNLEELYLSEIKLSGIDVSKNVNLRGLYIANTQISDIDLTKNVELLYMDASENQLSNIDLSNCTKLKNLYLSYNNLTSLELGKNKDLESVFCCGNKLTSIDISGCPKLQSIDFDANQLSILNTNYNPELQYIYCADNKIDELDLSKNTKLLELYCFSSKLKSINISGCSNLLILDCNTNELEALDISSCPNLELLSCYGNNLKTLDISKNQNLVSLSADNNAFAMLDFTGHSKFIETYKNPDFSKVYTYELKGQETQYQYIGKTIDACTYSIELSLGTRIVVSGEMLQMPAPEVGEIPPAYEPDTPDMSAGDFVNRCYSVALGRDADEEGFKYWLDALNSGSACGAQVGYGFIFSQEYINKNRSDEEFVTDLYSMYFGRKPDEGGFNHWMDMLNSGASREEVFAGFANSTEFNNLCQKYGVVTGTYISGVDNNVQGGINCFVARLYSVFLYRLPDQGGQSDWVNKLVNGEITGAGCAYGFVFSPEYIGSHPEYESFVACMYRGFFGREPDQEGFEAWVIKLNSGASYKEVFDGFAGSAEFVNLCASYGIQP